MLSDKKAQTEKNAKDDFITLMLLKQILQMHLMEVYDSSCNNQFPNLC